jgi:hypothetical protein
MKFNYQLAVLTITLLLIQVSYVYAGNSTAQSKSKGKAVCGPSKANSNANKNKTTGAGGNNNAAGVVKDVPNTPPPCTDNSESTEIIIDGQAYYCTVMNGSRRCYKY